MSVTSASKEMMKYQYQLNDKLADENRNWQERMANSAHQREIADLQKAGLNPVLSVTGGNGATTPTGSTASVSDGAGYASALANLEAAQISSATQWAMHTTPGANTLIGQIEYIAKQAGIDLKDALDSTIFALRDNSDQDLLSTLFPRASALGHRIAENKNHKIAVRFYETMREQVSALAEGNKYKASFYEKRLNKLKGKYPSIWFALSEGLYK